jgi:urea transporter/murein DD-endopeptidase MepM/ murein hydrolase activator NlpD
MTLNKYFESFKENILPATLNSYAVIFFLNNRLLAIGLLSITFFNFYAGLSGLTAALTAVLIANSMGFDKICLRKGLYSFNALLIGLGMGTFFDPGLVFFSLLILGVLLTLMISVSLSGWLGKYGLPYLSIPFVIGFWVIVLPSATFENLGLTHRNIYWINEAYSVGGTQLVNFLQSINSLSINNMADTYLRSLSSVFFQDNILSGLLIAILLLMSSRIAFSLTVTGFLAAYLFAAFTGSDTAGFSYYNIGANYIMTSLAIGGFFLIPSRKSYLWTFILVPLTSVVLLFLTKLFGEIQLPVFSLPFSLVVILSLYFLMMRKTTSGLILTPIQHYTPETNLYTYSNNKLRLSQLSYFPFHLPFWGKWLVSQGHDGKFTHKGDWKYAYDFILLDEEMKSYHSNGLLCDNYHCYNKPVLSPADGIIEEIIDQIDDNEIGKADTVNNWGNTMVIRHLPGLYTQLSHLKKGSFKVAKGDSVKRGDVLANCGNSGRSHQPHIHFQVQSSPVAGAKTMNYPFAYFLHSRNSQNLLSSFTNPLEGEMIADVQVHTLLKNSFGIQPNRLLKFSFTDENGIEHTVEWEAFTDAYNCNYLYCSKTESTAYYVNDGSMFYFTTFYGNKKSLLYYFYLTSFKVLLGYYENLAIKDELPLNTIFHKNGLIWLHDFIAPFSNRIRACYTIKPRESDDAYNPEYLTLDSSIYLSVFGTIRHESSGSITLMNDRIEKFTYENKKLKIEAKCVDMP